MSMHFLGAVPEGEVYEVVLKNRRGLQARIISLGASLKSLLVPDGNGKLRDVVLGYDTAEEYEAGEAYFGATVGRFANRIRGASYEWEGRQYVLDANEGENMLHGGRGGFSRRLWTPIVLSEREALFRLTSPDGDMGFPGQVQVQLHYALEGSSLVLRYEAISTKTTPFSVTHHSYFNLAGHEQADISSHSLTVRADAYTPADEALIPTGEVVPVEGTALDLRSPRLLGELWKEPSLEKTGGLDHNFVLSGQEGAAAVLSEPGDGLSLQLFTDRPALQVYTAGALGAIIGKGGVRYRRHQGICLEPQAFPDAVHHPNFPGCMLKAGELWQSETRYQFDGCGVAEGRRAKMFTLGGMQNGD